VTNLNIEGSNYTASAILYAGSNVTIRTAGGTNFIDGVASETTFGTMTGIDIEGSNYTTSAILYAGSNTTIRTDGGTNFIDSSAAGSFTNAIFESGSPPFESIGFPEHFHMKGGENMTIRFENEGGFFDPPTIYLDSAGAGTLTNANIEGVSYTNGFILYAGSNMSVRVAGGTNFFDSTYTNTDTTYTAGTNLDLTGTQFNLDAAAQASDDLADSSLQDADIGVTIQAYDADLDALAINNGSGLTNLNLTVHVDATNSASLQWWAASNRFAIVQIIGTTTNVHFVSP